MAWRRPIVVPASLLLLLLLMAVGPVPPMTAAAEHKQEAEIMQRLRQARCDSNESWAAELGWLPGDPRSHCHWHGIGCREGRVVSIKIVIKPQEQDQTMMASVTWNAGPFGSGSSGVWPGTLLPELAQLQWLERMEQQLPALRNEIPAEWGAPGAFPRLRQLQLDVPRAGSTLPDIQPGALPRLKRLFLHMPCMRAPLPSSWGSSPAVLPSLQALVLALQFTSGLPPQWAGGFPKLEQLTIDWVVPKAEPAASSGGLTPAVAPAPVRLPAEWAQGFQRLRSFELSVGHVEGTLDIVWPQAFPAITELLVSPPLGEPAGLSGTLPDEFFRWHPNLQRLGVCRGTGGAMAEGPGSAGCRLSWLWRLTPSKANLKLRSHKQPLLPLAQLSGNQLTGTLPAAWAELAPQVVYLGLEGNRLQGPAFPAAWLKPGAMPNLSTLELGSNQLTGSLPPHLSWPSLTALKIDYNAALRGNIPAAWCTAPFRKRLARMWIRGTDIHPALPPCYATEVTELSVDVHPDAAAAAVLAGGAGMAANIFPVALAAGAAAVLAVIGRVLVRRRRLRRRAAERLREQNLEHARLLRASELGNQQLGGGNRNAASRRARVEALVQHGGLRSITLLRLNSLPKALQHQIVECSQSGKDSACTGPLPSGHARSAGIELQQLRHPTVRPGDSTGMPSDVLGSRVKTSANSTMPSRQWRLGTNSLQLGADELTLVTEAWGEPVVLGEGATATVYLAQLQGNYIALKVMELAPGMSSQLFWQEARLLQLCNHSRIVPLYGVGIQSNLLLLALGLMHGGSLKMALQSADRRDKLRWSACGRQVAIDVAEALAYLHGQNVLHGDICARNVLLDADDRALVGDLGLSQYLQTASMRTVLGASTLYAAPEVLLGRRCTLAADIYSLGVLLIELTTRTLGLTRGRQFPSTPVDCPEEVLELIQQCIVQEPAQRPTAVQVLQCLREAH